MEIRSSIKNLWAKKRRKLLSSRPKRMTSPYTSITRICSSKGKERGGFY